MKNKPAGFDVVAIGMFCFAKYRNAEKKSAAELMGAKVFITMPVLNTDSGRRRKQC